ncbi:MAG: hypothetical protein AAGF92_20995, partial [Myxococcota bacterium]
MRPMMHRPRPSLHIALAVCAGAFVPLPAAAQYVSGDVYYAATNGEIVNVTGGGDLTGQVFTDTEQYTAGQLAWAPDLSTMYLGLVNDGLVLAIDSEGGVTTFAEGLDGPTGLLMTRDQVLLVAEFNEGAITDITAGGDMTGVAPMTDGLSGPRHLAELSDGTILVADQFEDAVYDVLYPTGGTVGAPFASGLPAVRAMIATEDDTIYAGAQRLRNQVFVGAVFDITGGGDFESALPYASGQSFFSLTMSGDDRLLSGEVFGSELWDITGGGDFAAAAPFATGLPPGETSVGTVPTASAGTGGAGGAGGAGGEGAAGGDGGAGGAGGAGGGGG